MSRESEPAPTAAELAERTRTFIRSQVLPIEDRFNGDIEAAGGDELRVRLQDMSRSAGVFAPHVPGELGGHGLGMLDRASVFEEAGFSLFGGLALNVAAPDEGNVHLLASVASEDQRERFLAPLARGEVRSAFAMTEPAPGAGSDPSALATSARRVGGGWRLNGRKWFITGADGAAFCIVMARTRDRSTDGGGATMFLVPSEAEGFVVGRHLGTMDRSMVGGHCEITLTDVFVPDGDVLGGVDEGFRYAQVRLGPARMTHVMRWLGAARRAHEVAVGHVANREAFGGRLADLGMMHQLIADNEIDLAACRALLQRACAELDAGERASQATSVAKTFAGEALFRVADRSMQMCGGLGTADDLPVARIFREIRPFRIYDGPSEVHRWSIARRAIRTISAGAS
jgi:acyl-CoA dehydrogenase